MYAPEQYCTFQPCSEESQTPASQQGLHFLETCSTKEKYKSRKTEKQKGREKEVLNDIKRKKIMYNTQYVITHTSPLQSWILGNGLDLVTSLSAYHSRLIEEDR